MPPRRNIDFQSVWPAELHSVNSKHGQNVRWPHRAQPYVPQKSRSRYLRDHFLACLLNHAVDGQQTSRVLGSAALAR